MAAPDTPRVIPRPEHTLSRRDISLEALKVLYRLHHTGYLAYLVGGSVRDLLVGKRPKDFDIATDARPGEIRKLFRNSRVIGRRFRLVQVYFRGGRIVEVSTFRRRSEFEDRADDVLVGNNTFGTPAEDAQRRDLTINGLFYNIGDFSLVDYVGGLQDLREGLIRVIGDPAVRFHRDPVRMLRVLRHAARLGFRIDPPAWEEIRRQRHNIRLCPPARLRDELLKDLKSGAARPFLELMLPSGLFYAILPSWQKRLGKKGEARLLELCHRLDLLAAGEFPPPEGLIWAAFLTPYLEQESLPETYAGLREVMPEKVRQALAAIEFPRQRQEEVSQVLALAWALTPLLLAGKAAPARLARLVAYREALRLHRFWKAPQEELPHLVEAEEAPPDLPPVKRRRRWRRRPRAPRPSPPKT